MAKKKPASEAAAESALTLPERCGISTAQQIVAAGLSLAPGDRLMVAASEVQRMSCATAIALISVAMTAASDGGSVVIQAPSAVFTDAFADLGLFEFLMKMEFA